MPGSIRRYIARVDEGGRLVIIKSDGTPITMEELAWFNQTVSRQLRVDLATGSKGTTEDEILYGPDIVAGTNRAGETVVVHPLLHSLKSKILLRGWRFASLSQLLGRRPSAVSQWLRGENEPRFKDVVALFGLLGYKFIPIPLEIASQIGEQVDAAEERLANDMRRHSMGE